MVYCCGYTNTFKLSEAWQGHYLLSHNFWHTAGFSGYTYTFRLSGMTGALPAESQLLVYCCDYTYTFGLSELWFSSNFSISTESQLLVYYCEYTYTFRLSEAWQECYLLSHNFWYTVVAIPIIQAVIGMTGASPLSNYFWCIVVAIPIHSGCQRHDRSITYWVTTSGVLLWLYLYIQAVRHDRSITCWVTTSGVLLWLYLYIQTVRGMTGALTAESQLVVYCCGYTYTFRLSGALPAESYTSWVTTLDILLVSLAISIHSGCQVWQEHYLLSHNWCTVGFSGCTYTIKLSEASQKHYLLSHNFWCTVHFSGLTYTFRLSDAWQEHYLLSHNILYNDEAITIHSGCHRHDRSINCWDTTFGILLWLYLYIQAVRGMTGALTAETQHLVYCCGYTYTFRLSEACQEHYLLSHNFWYTVGFSGYTYTFRLSEAWQEHYLLSHSF